MKRSTYVSIHNWVRYHYGKPTHCSNNPEHTAKRFEWANISGEYKRYILDWKQLCPSCHRKMDYTERQREISRKRFLGNTYRRVKINQLDLSGNLIKQYPSIMQAENELNILRTSISNVLSGRAKTAGGFIWTYQQ